MLLIVLLVMYVVVMLLWGLSLLGAIPNSPAASPWLAFFACLLLGAVVFLVGSSTASFPR